MRKAQFILVICLLFIFTSFIASCSHKEASSAKYAGTLSILGSDGTSIHYELADTSLSRTLGLMYRESLPNDAGMLFDFQADSTAAFWMKNTLIDLDMIFIDSQWKIIYIHHDVTPCKKDPCATYPAPQPYQYVLEVNGGFSEDHGVEVGQIVQRS